MVALKNTAEGYTSGTTVATGTSGGSSGNAFNTVTPGSGGTITADNGVGGAAGTSMAYKYVATTSAASTVVWNSSSITGAPTTAWCRAYIYLSSLPPSSLRWAKFQTTSGVALGSSEITAAGKVRLSDASGTQQALSTSTIPTGKWVRVEIEIISSASGGQLFGRLFFTNQQNIAPSETFQTASNINTNGGGVLSLVLGASVAIASTTFYQDEYGYSDVTWPGPSGAGVPAYGGAAMVGSI